ncbi:MAG TPA: hypothetical protein VL092_13020 [Chitinophagaceae bacterium]|nr:hypothetical protein [Chitinophagaceae bacterium]
MKKLVLAVAALGLISLTSCKKDYTCECTVSGLGSTSTTIKDTKKKAKDACEKMSSSVSMGGTTITSSCAIK